MEISQQGLELIKQFEGLRLTAYQDSKGVWTIGYGHTKTARRGMSIDQTTADRLLRNDANIHASPINKYVKVPLKQHQFDALASFIFNVGEGAFKKSTLLKVLNQGDYEGAAREFLRWNKIYVKGKPVILNGLAKRRQRESQFFLLGT